MDVVTVTRQVVLFLHTVSFAIALATVLKEDLALARASRINAHRLGDAARTVTFALISLWVTGLALVAFEVGFDISQLVGDTKLAAKVFVVVALTANGIALHTVAFPILVGRKTRARFGVAMPVVLGAISTASWLYASFIGVSRSMAPMMTFTDYMALYGMSLILAIVIALTFVRPRVERLLMR